MNKVKRFIAVSAAFAASAVGMVGLAACDDEPSASGGTSGGNVSDEVWEQMLGIDFETENNFTYISETAPTYPKDKAEEYGEWRRSVSSYRVDNEKQVLIYSYSSEQWQEEEMKEQRQDDGSYLEVLVPAHFDVSVSTEYYFVDGGTYYCADYSYRLDGATNKVDESWSGGETTKAEFIRRIESASNSTTLFSYYERLKGMFKYDEETDSYVLASMGTIDLSIRFGEGSVSMIFYENSLWANTSTISDVGTTDVTIPQAARNAVR